MLFGWNHELVKVSEVTLLLGEEVTAGKYMQENSWFGHAGASFQPAKSNVQTSEGQVTSSKQRDLQTKPPCSFKIY